MYYKFGTVILIPFPFTDLTSTKLRPGLIISKTHQKGKDVIVAFITSKIPDPKNASHFYLPASSRHFQATGLKTDSLVRFDKIATLSKNLILGEMGMIHPDILKQMKRSFHNSFGF